jgi:hypothetical protein
MKEELQNKLYEKYPKIFGQKDLPMQETAMCWGIACGDGWYNILDVLCNAIQTTVDNPHKNIEMYKRLAKKAFEEGKKPWAETCLAHIEKEKALIINQVEATQVKEKYGTLSFYVNDYASEEVRNYIRFAGLMSAVTCEGCGAPGTVSGQHWIQTMCEPCKVQIQEQRYKDLARARQLRLDFDAVPAELKTN